MSIKFALQLVAAVLGAVLAVASAADSGERYADLSYTGGLAAHLLRVDAGPGRHASLDSVAPGPPR